MGKDKRTHFWASYADLMTSLFFLMVVLFIISIVELKQIDATPLEVKEFIEPQLSYGTSSKTI